MEPPVLSPSDQLAHALALQNDPEGHPKDCAACDALTKEPATVAEPTLEALASQVAALTVRAEAAEAKAASLEAAQDAEAVETAHAAALAAKDEEIAAKVTELDTKDAELVAAQADAQAATERAEAAEKALVDKDAEAEKAEDMKKVKEARAAELEGRLSPARIEARLDDLAELSEDAWTEYLADLPAKSKAVDIKGKKGIADAAAPLGGTAATDAAPLEGTSALRSLLTPAGRKALAGTATS